VEIKERKKRLKRIAGESSKRLPEMKITLYSSTLILASCYNVERNCKDFKTGKFRFDYEVDGVTKQLFFERNDSLEIETYDGKTDTASIRWVNDCSIF
jgi:hypothetical protein